MRPASRTARSRPASIAHIDCSQRSGCSRACSPILHALPPGSSRNRPVDTCNATWLEPMRVLVLTHNYPRFPGDPAGAFVRRIAVGEAARGHEVTVVAPHAPGLATAMDDAGVALRRFRYAPDALETVAYRGTMHHATAAPRRVVGLPLFLLAFWRAIRRAVATTRPDVIHAHWWLPSAWLARGREYRSS